MIKKFSTLLLTATLVLSMIPATMASTAQSNQTIYSVAQSYETKLVSFRDIDNSPAKEAIDYLLGREIVMGYDNGEFRPTATLTNAEAIALLTKAFNLEMEQEASRPFESHFKHIDEGKWYSNAYHTAYQNEVKLDSGVKINETVSREQFAGWIMDQLDRIGVYPVVRMFINIADANQIDEDYSEQVHKLLLTRIAKLPEDQTFRPTDAITREEAAEWIEAAVRFADDLKAKQENVITSNLPFEYDADKALSYGEATTLLTKALKLNSNDTAGLISGEIKDTATISREQFATWIVEQFDKIGPYPVKMMFIHIADEQEITLGMSYKIHTLLLTDIAQLNEEGQFRPQDNITGAEAVEWLEKSAEFAERLRVTAAELE